MDIAFAEYLEGLAAKYEAMMGMMPIAVSALPRSLPSSGVYMMSEGPKHLYVGRTRRLRRRLIEHSDPRRTEAPFAFRLAREAVGKITPSYRPTDSRKALLAEPEFRDALARAKARIREMDIRYVAEDDHIRQALLEVYVAVVTRSPYNDFKTS